MAIWQGGHPFARYLQSELCGWAGRPQLAAGSTRLQGKHKKWQRKIIVVPEDLADFVRAYVVLIDLSV